jgi:acyl-[acyl-carrier-protein]-phospholipid O-acyltransferase/long-chain-fatty-acid--[acyl-carrier-protein] ligase
MHTLRYVIAGAEKLSDEVRKLWAEKHLKVLLEGYGTTETAPVVSVNTPMGNRMGTVGRAVPGLELHFEPFQGVENGGQLFVKGPNVMLGYMRYDNPGVIEPTGAGFKPGWHDTGDVVTLDDDSFLRIVDRAGRFWNPSGEKIALSITEELAGKISKGTHAAIKRADKAKGEGLVFFTTDPELTRDKLLRAAQETGTPEVCVPRESDIHVLPALPLLPTGKTDFVSLKNLVAA